jgi:dTDP-glucose 4,6-dehydratase
LVTGGLGAVGRPLVAQLRAQGETVWIADDKHNHDPYYIRCDVGEFRQVESALDAAPFDLVYHLAAEFGRWNGEDFYETLWRTNAVGTKHMIRMQERLGFRMVFTSSSEVYGDHRGVMTEDVMDQSPVRQMNDYAITKWVSEQQIMNSADEHGTETVRVRLFNTYGPGEHYSSYRSAVCLFVYRALHGIPYTVYTGHRRTSSYVDDTARTLANIANRFKPGEVYNIAGTECHDMRTVNDIVLRKVGRADDLVEYREAESRTTRDKLVDPEKAVRDLDHHQTVGLEDGIGRTVAWQREVYHVQGI